MRQADYPSIPANITVINNDFTSQFTTYMFAATYFRDQTQFYHELNWLALGISHNDDVLTTSWNSN